MEIKVDEPAAWLVAAGGFLMNMLVIGYLKSLGILMLIFQAHFNCSNTIVMFTTASTAGLISGLAPLHSTVTHKYVHVRHTTMASGVIICTLMCTVHTWLSQPLWLASMGFGIGCCLSLVYSSVICKVSECFDRRRDLANGLAFAGSSAGAILVPPAVSRAVSGLSARDSCLLIGAYFLHLAIVGALIPSRIVVGSKCPKLAENSATAAAGKGGIDSGEGRGLDRRMRWLAGIFVLASGLGNVAFVSQYTMLPMYFAEHQVYEITVATAIAFQGAIDFTFRILTGWMSSSQNWRKSHIMSSGAAVMGVTCVAMVIALESAVNHQQRVAALFCYAAGAGASGAVYMVSTTAVIISFVGIHHLSYLHSLSCFVWAFITYPGQTAFGYVKDRSGSYSSSMITCGLLMLISSCCLLAERCFRPAAAGASSDSDAGDAAAAAASPGASDEAVENDKQELKIEFRDF